jgi:tRNA threonylcarbamoyladenosine biosynthesis protein TsaE
VVIATEEAMLEFGKTLSSHAEIGAVFLLYGALGVGKTTLARGFIHGLGYSGPVISPTFPILQLYETTPPVCHADLYRLETAEAVLGTGLTDCFMSHCVIVEWPDRAECLWPEDSIRLWIDIVAEGREVRCSGL